MTEEQMKIAIIITALFAVLFSNSFFDKTSTENADFFENQQKIIDIEIGNDDEDFEVENGIPKTEQSEEPEEDFPYIRLNLDDTKPVSGVAPVQYNGKAGIINSNGKII